jgi:membrane protein DedA with SNARE-associated domain
MNFPRFLIYTTLGSLPWTFALVYAGKLLGDNWEQVRAVLAKFDYVVIAVVMILVAWYIYHHVSRAARPGAAGRPTKAGGRT